MVERLSVSGRANDRLRGWRKFLMSKKSPGTVNVLGLKIAGLVGISFHPWQYHIGLS